MQAVKCVAKVGSKGELILPKLRLKKNSMVEVIVLITDEEEEKRDMLAAAESSLGFWDNPIDDKIWNHA